MREFGVEEEKIGIATFHCAENYGAFLQAFALSKWIQDRTLLKVMVVNYRPEYLLEPYKICFKKRLAANMPFPRKCKAFISFCVEVPYRLVRKRKFKKAEALLPLTGKYVSAEFKLDASYKGIILGSDQIWNTSLTQGLDPVYWGGTVSEPCKKIAYAASIGLSEYPNEIKEKAAEMFAQIDYIGVREEASVDLIQSMLKKQVMVNVDPVMLVGRDFWHRYECHVAIDNYILVYCVRNNPYIMQDAYRLAKMYNKRILHFGDPSIRAIFPDIKVHSLSYCGPFDFISYISQADIILTDSFHAMCFSIIYNRRFFVYLNKTRSERLLTLATIGKCSDRLIEWGGHLRDENIQCAFSPAKDYYENFYYKREESQEYLLSAMKGLINEADKNG